MINIDNSFDNPSGNKFQYVYTIHPKVFNDERGSFSEVMKEENDDKSLFENLNWIKQINRSKSSPRVIRGMHAQKGPYTQSKLVEAITGTVYDIITDARPDSSTLGLTKVYELNSTLQNKLFVPKGFLHGFIVPEDSARETIFNYYCDNVYNKESEFSISPKSLFTKLTDLITEKDTEYKILKSIDESYVYSEKDLKGLEYENFMEDIIKKYKETKVLWYA